MLPSPAFLHVPRQVQERGEAGGRQNILIAPPASHRAKKLQSLSASQDPRLSRGLE